MNRGLLLIPCALALLLLLLSPLDASESTPYKQPLSFARRFYRNYSSRYNNNDENDNSKRSASYKTFYFTQQLDHFNFANQQVFKQRYLINGMDNNPVNKLLFSSSFSELSSSIRGEERFRMLSVLIEAEQMIS